MRHASALSGTRPRRAAIAAISARPFAASFDLMFETCTLAVFSLMNRSVAISRLVRPSALSCGRRRANRCRLGDAAEAN